MPRSDRGGSSPAVHAASIGFFALLTLSLTWPLAAHLRDAVLGAGAGDNMSALWNIWWARTALQEPLSFFWTPAIFAPFGTNLVLHSYAPLESAVAGALVGFDPVLAYNVALVAAVLLNLACSYWAAWTITRDPLASCVAGVAFGGAPFLLGRLHGHFNVLNAWGLPLLLIATRRYGNRPGAGRAAVLGLALAILAYTDAYFAIFGLVLAGAYLALCQWSLRPASSPMNARRRFALRMLLVLIAIVAAMIAWIEWTGGTDTRIIGIRIRMTDSFNPRVALGFLIAGACLAWKWPIFRVETREVEQTGRHWRLLAVALAVTAVLCVPLFAAAVQVWRAGDYESQVYFWRSAPPGIDLAALLLGNPYGLVTGHWSLSAYQRLGIDRSESAVWLGLASVALLVSRFRRLTAGREARSFLWIAGLFLVWSLGPYLRVLGFNTAFMLPQTFLRFVPIVANARIPGRAFVVVLLMSALLSAMALATIGGPRRRRLVGLAAVAVLVLDFLPAVHPWVAVDQPEIYATLQRQPPGIVLEIPFGWRDGFGKRGDLDHRALLYQTLHEQPEMGGFVARLSSRIKQAYEADPIIRPILDLSEGRSPSPSALPASPPDPALPAAPALPAPPALTCQLTCGVRYVVIDEERASNELKAFVAQAFPLTLVERSGARALYIVEERRSVAIRTAADPRNP